MTELTLTDKITHFALIKKRFFQAKETIFTYLHSMYLAKTIKLNTVTTLT